MNSPMRVAVIAPSAPPHSAGGVAAAHYNLFQALKRRGFATQLFTFEDNHQNDEADILRNGSPSWLANLFGFLNWLFSSLIQPGKQSYHLRDIVRAQFGARRMVRALEVFEPNIIVLSDHGAPGLALSSKLSSAQVILVSHHNPARFLDQRFMKNPSKLDIRWAIRLEQQVLNKVDAVVCPSNYMLGWFNQTYEFIGPVAVIPNILDSNWIEQIQPQDPRARLKLPASAPIIYMPSAGSLLKGGSLTPQIIERLAQASLKPIGFYIPGFIEEGVREALSGLPEFVHLYLPGQLAYEIHVAVVKSCSFGISPSLLENYSMAILEAVHCGVPMLVFDTGGNRDIIRDDHNGYLVQEGDVEALCEVARPLLSAGVLKPFKAETREYSRRELDPDRAIQAYVDLIESLAHI